MIAFLSITKITYDPNNTNVFYFCTGEGWFNADAVRGPGYSNRPMAERPGFNCHPQILPSFSTVRILTCIPLPAIFYVATRPGGLQRSTNGGESWQKVLGSGAGSGRNSICDERSPAMAGCLSELASSRPTASIILPTEMVPPFQTNCHFLLPDTIALNWLCPSQIRISLMPFPFHQFSYPGHLPHR